MQIYPWQQIGSNVVVPATTVSSAATQLLAAIVPTGNYNVRVAQDGLTTGFIRFGNAAVAAATAADIPILGGSERILQWPGDATHCTVIMRSGTANFDVSFGLGV